MIGSENEIPKIDLPEDVIAGVLNDSSILSLYTNFPCRIKAEIFVLCKKGNIDAAINLADYHVSDNSFLVIQPGWIFQINRIIGEVEIFFAGFSSDFLRTIHAVKSMLDVRISARHNPIVPLEPSKADLIEEYFRLGIKTKEQFRLENRDLTHYMYFGIIYALSLLYGNQKVSKESLSPIDRISQDFSQLVLDNYTKEKNVAFYAGKLGITPAYLSTIIKQATGKTCMEIISNMVIMDAKARLKSTNLPIYQIADALNFENVSFFGKYFKRHVGISPLEYRNGKSKK